MPKVFFSRVRLVFTFVVLLSPSTADVVCPRFVHTDGPWRFRAMSRFSIVSFPPRLMRWVTTWMYSVLYPFVYREALPSFLLLLDFLAPRHTSQLLLDLSCFLAYLFPRLTALHSSPSHVVILHSSYCYCLWPHIVDHWLHTEIPP